MNDGKLAGVRSVRNCANTKRVLEKQFYKRPDSNLNCINELLVPIHIVRAKFIK